jgi:hypothetical protein
MYLVRDFEEKDSAVAFYRRLRKNGIAGHVAMFRGNNTRRYGGGEKTWAVWVLLKEQHPEALILIKSKRYKVKSPLSEKEIVELESQISKRNLKKIAIESSLILLVVLIALGVLLNAIRNA